MISKNLNNTDFLNIKIRNFYLKKNNKSYKFFKKMYIN